jgi:NTP pyrophosphatase (non-canonical NTP hydrolase)
MKKELTFKKLRKVNIARCEKYFHKIEEWSEAEWACALAGEVGELCNFIKKRTRLLKSKKFVKGLKSNDYAKSLNKSFNDLGEEAKKEIGDIMCYLDLISARLGVTVEDCTRNKFNEVSDRVGSKLKL